MHVDDVAFYLMPGMKQRYRNGGTATVPFIPAPHLVIFTDKDNKNSVNWFND
jgi:hypothetical protein